MFNRFLLVFAFCGDSHNGTLSQAQSLQFKQAFRAGALPLEVTVISEVKPLASLQTGQQGGCADRSER